LNAKLQKNIYLIRNCKSCCKLQKSTYPALKTR